MKYNKKVLSNGLTIIEVPSHDAESVVVDFFVKTGSRSETPKENGISHFLEHFLFKGTKKYPSAMAISEVVDAIGGEMNANTGKEHTQFYIKAASKHLPLIFEMLTEMIQNPLLDREEMEREKGVIVEEINMYKDMPMAEIDNVLERTMWPSDALGRDIAGTKEIVTKFTREMFADYIFRHYQTPNMILGVSGKYNAKQLDELIGTHWKNYPKKRFYGWDKVADKQKQPRMKIDYKDTKQAHLALGFKGFAYGDKRNAAVSVLAAVLGGGMSSRMFTEVREKRGLGYYVRSSPGSYQDTGSFTVSAGVQVDKISEALKVILAELKKIKDAPVGAKEMLKAKEYIKGKSILALEDNQVRLDWFLERAAFYKNIETPEQVFKRIDSVTTSDVQKAARELFQNKKMTLAVIGPYKNEGQFKKILKV
ncbi:MAG: pitrilysin family protein [Candidatus Doudnabacteria bacterium]|nr:pitrilysin family protein [Candidatus Doudnabacteria bacterium]